LYKRQKEEEKRERVKRMEEDLEEKRILKYRALTERETKSELMREKQREEQNRKFKLKDEYYLQITTKINNNHRKEQRKAFKIQRELLEEKPVSLRTSRGSVANLSKSHPVRGHSQRLS
jgi:hypothetical protein